MVIENVIHLCMYKNYVTELSQNVLVLLLEIPVDDNK